MIGARRRAGWILGIAALGALRPAEAQIIDVERAHTVVVGTPTGTARAERVDAARTGRSPVALPVTRLRTAWRTTLGALIEQGPLVDAHGVTYVVGTRGEAMAISPDGVERWHIGTGAMQPGPPALLSDDTLVFVDGTGDAIAVRDGAVRWRTHFGRIEADHPAPLGLADGGVAVATAHDVAVLDAAGHERARITLSEPIAGPLLAAMGKIIAVGASGSVFSWKPGAPEPTRLVGFGSPTSEGAASLNDHTLVAVNAGQSRLMTVDLVRGAPGTLAVAPLGLFVGPPSTNAEVSYVLLATLTSELIVGFDARGSELTRVLLAAHPAALGPDGGPGALAATPPHIPLLVDGSGAVAFATAVGGIGVAHQGGADLLPDACQAAQNGPHSMTVAGIAPLGDGTLVCACASGSLLAIAGSPSAKTSDRKEPASVGTRSGASGP